jgi:serine/threonine protein kinase
VPFCIVLCVATYRVPADAGAGAEGSSRTVSSLNHPHSCTLYDIGEQDGIHYLVMEYLEGEAGYSAGERATAA